MAPRRNDFLIPTLAVILDALAVEFAFVFSYWLRFNTTALSFLPLGEDIPSFAAYFYGSLFILPVWLLLFKSRNLYRARRNIALSDEFVAIVKIATLGMLVVMSAAFFYRAFSYSRVVFGLLWGTSILSLFAGRYCIYYIERALYKRGRELRRAVIIGNNETASLIHRRFHNHPLLGYKLVGYFADSPAGPFLQDLPHLGSLREAAPVMAAEGIELALIAVDYSVYPDLYHLLKECEGVNVEFMMVPDMLEIMADSARMEVIEGVPFIQIKALPMTTWGRIVKRTFDIAVGGILCIFLSPLFVLLTVAIKLESRGPAFFRQERVGIDGKSFLMWKFRSMKADAEQETGPVWAAEKDPRRTRIGRFLRSTSLDELPQLLNVLRGEMSLVGPRPERPYFVQQFKDLIPKYLDRHRVKTGMTGWAQVNGLRGNTSLEERVKYDVYYIEHWSLWFDIRILLRTFGALLSRHAY